MASSASDVFANIINALLRMIGLGKRNDAEVLREQIKEWKLQKTALHDEVELLKEQIREMESRLRAKNEALKGTVGETRPIVEEEIRSLFHELDATKRRQEVLFGGINHLTTVIGQADQALQAEGAKISADKVRELQLQFSVALADMRETEREVAKLAATNYQRTPTTVANYDARRAALDQQLSAAQTADSAQQGVASTASTLTDAERERLARIAQTND